MLLDCEGCEFELLSAEVIRSLTGCDLLVELHDAIDSERVRWLIERFAPSHDVEAYAARQRDPGAFAELDVLAESDRQSAIQEVRADGQHWLYVSSRTHSGSY